MFCDCTALTNGPSRMSCRFTYSSHYATFQNCIALKSVDFPLVSAIDYYCFISCTSLSVCSFSVVETIGSYAFSGCTLLSDIFLYGSSVVSLIWGTTTFSDTPRRICYIITD